MLWEGAGTQCRNEGLSDSSCFSELSMANASFLRESRAFTVSAQNTGKGRIHIVRKPKQLQIAFPGSSLGLVQPVVFETRSRTLAQNNDSPNISLSTQTNVAPSPTGTVQEGQYHPSRLKTILKDSTTHRGGMC